MEIHDRLLLNLCRYGRPEDVLLLLRMNYEFDTGALDEDGNDALRIVAGKIATDSPEWGRRVAEALLDKGFDPQSASPSGQTATTIASITNPILAKRFSAKAEIGKDANIETFVKTGDLTNTSLYLQSNTLTPDAMDMLLGQCTSEDIATILREHGADPFRADKNGDTCFARFLFANREQDDWKKLAKSFAASGDKGAMADAYVSWSCDIQKHVSNFRFSELSFTQAKAIKFKKSCGLTLDTVSASTGDTILQRLCDKIEWYSIQIFAKEGDDLFSDKEKSRLVWNSFYGDIGHFLGKRNESARSALIESFVESGGEIPQETILEWARTTRNSNFDPICILFAQMSKKGRDIPKDFLAGLGKAFAENARTWGRGDNSWGRFGGGICDFVRSVKMRLSAFEHDMFSGLTPVERGHFALAAAAACVTSFSGGTDLVEFALRMSEGARFDKDALCEFNTMLESNHNTTKDPNLAPIVARMKSAFEANMLMQKERPAANRNVAAGL